ncbi:MAG: SMP-30/gluconolactonase/LRE family protein [Planctomycetes bacterium]|nr:SMP-30/gluconolactonase/LRE family protein [Planctomycetota bacterium]
MFRRPVQLLILAFFFVTSAAQAGSPVDSESKLETIATEFGLADGPAWDGNGALYFPDVKGQKLYRYMSAKKKVQVVLEDAGRISAAYYSHGKLFLSDNGNSRIVRLAGKEKIAIAGQDPDAKPPRRPNDLVVNGHGGIYYTLTGQKQVIYITPQGQQVTAVDGIDSPNGLILSPDEQTLYVASYVPKKIWAYDVKTHGTATNGRIFAAMDAGPEKGADGMAIDRAGNVYCAGPAHIWIWSPSGELLDRIGTPTRPINCAFGDQDMRSLYVTGFGGLYRQRMKISGRSPQPPSDASDQSSNAKRPPTTIPASIEAKLDIVFAQVADRKLLADVFQPASSAGPLPAIVVVHGGGWLNGDKSKFRALAIELAKRGYVTAAIEYRLGGEAKFPAGIQDCNAAVRFLRTNAKQFNLDPQRIGAVGGSAGGHLAGLMAAAPRVKELQGDGGNSDHSSQLQAAIVMAGPMQMTTGSVAERSRDSDSGSNSNQWLGKTIDEAPELYALADAHLHFSKDAPPVLFMTGEHDNPQRNALTRDKLKLLGVWTDVKIYKDCKHGCWNQLPWFNEMAQDMDEFFKEHL